MELIYRKEINVEKGQRFYGIIAVSTSTYDGVHPVIVDSINWNDEEIIFRVDQPCGYVSCSFSSMKHFVFKTEKEAKENLEKLDWGMGMFAC